LRSIIIIYIFLIFTLSGQCRLPESERSKVVLKRQSPVLQKQFKNKKLLLGSKIFIRIFKEEKKLEIWVEKNRKYVLFKSYPVLKFSGKLGAKLKEGDYQAPEGFYYVTAKRMNPNSRFHLSFNIGYPNVYDKSLNRTGSAIMVHGNKLSIGCFAMGDEGIEEIYSIAHHALNNGQKFFRVHIFPFHLTDSKLKRHKKSKWYSFWENLKEGYQWFEKYKKPPNVEVNNKRYVFSKS
jgi:murein L,D-transpeptidase YafK